MYLGSPSVRPVLRMCVIGVAGVTALAGCGGGGVEPAAVRASALVHGHPGYFDGQQLEQRLSNAFRSGLYRLAVMTQPGEEAADGGQQLPTGKISAVRCDPQARAPVARHDWPWRCEVRWQTVDGQARRTRYAIQLTPNSCYAAEAQPHYIPILDSTTGAASEHPLNTFGRGLGTC